MTTTHDDETAKVLRAWEKSAPGYDKQIAFLEKSWLSGSREWLGARAQGRVLEVAIGTGLNLPHYPADVTIAGVELSPAMLAIARKRAADLGRDADLHTGVFVTLIEHHQVHNFEHQWFAAGIDGDRALASFGTSWAVWSMIDIFF